MDETVAVALDRHLSALPASAGRTVHAAIARTLAHLLDRTDPRSAAPLAEAPIDAIDELNFADRQPDGSIAYGGGSRRSS